ncbi:MAG: SAM-dependent methyltransferase [Candidatus Kaiserbacteria bacterium]|nr:SAM-dependent methyltransferase [Candidatus Kaiserbacteria bacterium]
MDTGLDQFYTKPAVARSCIEHVQSVLNQLEEEPVVFVEPAAGTGSFVVELASLGLPVQAYDIDPQYPRVIKRDFLQDRIRPRGNRRSRVVVGNPPFGKRGSVALAFLNRSLYWASVVGLILPRQFMKYGTQKQVSSAAHLVLQETLPPHSFSTAVRDSVDIGCVFQVWTTLEAGVPDLRLGEKPAISHRDFILYQYNNTEEARKFFENDFDIAIFNQGYGEYPTFRTSASSCEKNKQWLLVKTANKGVLDRIKKMDYKTLSEGNTTVPGFRKADFVREYVRLYES